MRTQYVSFILFFFPCLLHLGAVFSVRLSIRWWTWFYQMNHLWTIVGSDHPRRSLSPMAPTLVAVAAKRFNRTIYQYFIGLKSIFSFRFFSLAVFVRSLTIITRMKHVKQIFRAFLKFMFHLRWFSVVIVWIKANFVHMHHLGNGELFHGIKLQTTLKQFF